ncbi:MAG: NAD(P)H-hydrate dehydratase [Rhodocyclaceae bacterium]|nr:NAD(P)H-hydrate dehydratase [Rhodocyclaceae bacterium]
MPFPRAIPLYRTEAIRAVEQHFLPGATPSLMERAGAAAAEVALTLLQVHPGPVLVAAGPGNNGGDGFVLARRLRAAGHEVVVAFAGDAGSLPADAAQAITDWGAAGGDVLTELPDENSALAVDALFGIGLSRPLEGKYGEWIDRLNGLHCPILALDTPSGLDADTGRVWGKAVRATHTATFIAAKPGLYTLEGPDHAGVASIHDLGLDASAIRPAEGLTVTPTQFLAELRPRPKNSHKGTNGSAGILGGAQGMPGAALLAGRAALMLGAGRVFVGFLDATAPSVDPIQPELMIRHAEALLTPGQCTCLAVGPGLGQSEAAAQIVARAASSHLPMVLDADALNLMAHDPALARRVAERRLPALLTPHPAEAARLLSCSTAEVQADRIRAALEIARRFHAYTVLKGCGSVIATPDCRWRLNTNGNPGMASAGMGDVLSGMAVALLSQGWRPEQALLAAVHLHGAAADACVAAGLGPVGLTAGELIPAARRLLNDWIAAHD